MFKVLRTFMSFKCHRSIDNSIDFYHFTCREKAHDNKEFNDKSSKPCCKSQITTHLVKPYLKKQRSNKNT